MTVRVFIHSNSKRAETISLLDSGATENFLNLDYAKWLKLPIKRLPFPRKLFNVDGTENKAGQLQFYTDLAIRTGSTTTNMRFFLTQLGEHKAILGYPWFAAVQPKIDWRRGWIDHTQLLIVFKTSDAAKARFLPRTINKARTARTDKILLCKVTIGPRKKRIKCKSRQNTLNTVKYLAKKNPSDSRSTLSGTTQSNYYRAPRPRYQDDSYPSTRKKSRKFITSSKNI